MSTILKALKRLEHEKEDEVARSLAHDPLAPAAAASPPERPSKRPPVWLATAVAAAVVGAAGSYGLASWWFSRDGQAAPADVAAAGRADRVPLAAIPAESRRSTSHDAAARQATPHPKAAPRRAEIELAQATGGDPDPWEQAAARPSVAARPPSQAPAPGNLTAESLLIESPVVESPVVESPVAESQVGDAGSRSAGRREMAEPIPSRRPDPEPMVKGAIPVASLPVAELPDSWTEPEPQVDVEEVRAVKATPDLQDRSVPRTEVAVAAPKDVSPSPLEPEPVAVIAVSDRLDVVVVGTVWHPKPERRSAQLKLDDRADLVEAREGDVIEGYLIREITPSSVVISRGEVVVTHRVGR